MDKNKIRLLKSLEEIIVSKPLEKITISEICEGALLTRPTFYHYFKDKYDLVNWAFDELFQKTFEEIGLTASWQDNIEHFLLELKKHQKFYTPAYQYVGQNSLESHHTKRVYEFYKAFYEKEKGSPLSYAEDFSLEIYCRGAVFMVAEWGRKGFVQDPIVLIELFKYAMTDEIQKYLIK